MDPYQVTFETWNKVAALYQEKFMDLHLYDDTYDRFLALVHKKGARVFEIGCGPGNITRYLLAKRPDLHIDAIDVAPNMIELARKNVPQAFFEVRDCRDLDKLEVAYDAVMCGFALPYLSQQDCAKLFKDCAHLLNPGGVAYFSTIEGDYAQSGFEAASTGDATYMYYHDEKYLRQQLDAAALNVKAVMRKQSPKGEGNSTELILIVRKD
jgi:trans-aconitate methyltransferase